MRKFWVFILTWFVGIGVLFVDKPLVALLVWAGLITLWVLAIKYDRIDRLEQKEFEARCMADKMLNLEAEKEELITELCEKWGYTRERALEEAEIGAYNKDRKNATQLNLLLNGTRIPLEKEVIVLRYLKRVNVYADRGEKLVPDVSPIEQFGANMMAISNNQPRPYPSNYTYSDVDRWEYREQMAEQMASQKAAYEAQQKLAEEQLKQMKADERRRASARRNYQSAISNAQAWRTVGDDFMVSVKETEAKRELGNLL